MLIVQKIMVFLFVFSILICIREIGNYLLTVFDKRRNAVEITKTRLILFACAISYIFTIIFTGFRLF